MNKNDKNDIKKLIPSALLLFITFVVLLSVTLAWFLSQKQLDSSSMKIDVNSVPDIKVTAKQDDDKDALVYTSVETPEDGERIFRVLADSNTNKIAPGSSGQFSFWVSAENTSTFTVRPKVCPGGITITRDDDGSVTAVTEAKAYRDNTTSEMQSKADGYMQGHILLFTDKTNDVYSGWLDPEEKTVLSLSDDDAKTGFTVYWIWVDSYFRFTSDTLIDSADLQKISERNFTSGSFNEYAAAHLFDTRGKSATSPTATQLGHYYDFGDEDIGLSVENLYFNLEFTS